MSPYNFYYFKNTGVNDMRILFIGFGNVAKETARILTEKELYPRLHLDPTVIGIFTQRHGGVENTKGLNLKSVLCNLKERNSLPSIRLHTGRPSSGTMKNSQSLQIS